MKAMDSWFENNDGAKLTSNSVSQINDLQINEILNEQFNWNQWNKITFTPAIIINNHLFPDEYDRYELLYFITNLVDEEDFE